MFLMVSLCSPSKYVRRNLPCGFAHVGISKLLARDQAAINCLAEGLANERPFNAAGLNQIKNRSERSGVLVARPNLYIWRRNVRVMKHYNSRHLAIAPEV